MIVRRVFWIHHANPGTNEKPTPKQTDFGASRSHQSCADELYSKHGQYGGEVPRFAPFAEVLSSTLTEDKREAQTLVESPKHLGTALLLDPVEWQEMDTRGKSRQTGKVV